MEFEMRQFPDESFSESEAAGVKEGGCVLVGVSVRLTSFVAIR